MLAAIADYGRLLRAGVSLARHDVVLPSEYKSRMPAPALGVGKLLRLLTGGAQGRPGERLAKALESLGPAYIKLGQFIATRPDVFGVEATQDLSRLKDKLPPFSMDKAKDALQTEFQPDKASALFPELSEPIAAASIAQVHKLKTEDGVWAVKILRPGVEQQIRRELRAMKRAASDVERTSEDSRRLEPVAFVDTVAAAMEKELDLTLEAGATDEMREKTSGDGHFLIPFVDWERSGRRVLTTSWVDGKPMTDSDALHGINNKPELANAVTRGFLTHAIYHGVFHADMHEGNMILTPDNRIALVDFGIVGRIGPNERRFLAEILYGFLKRDYRRIAEVHFEAGYVPPDRSVDDFAQALRSVGEPIHGKAAEDVSMGKLLLQLFDITHVFGMHLRPELVLLQKTMVQIEGVARNIDPAHNIWKAAEPIVEKWIRTQLGPAGAAKLVRENVREVSDRLKRLPQMMDAMEQAVAKVNAMPTQPKRERFAPWWGWFAFLGLIAVLVTGIIVEN
ncbi:MAG: AarF/UbiB family protein [Pseudomonadota bacterium]